MENAQDDVDTGNDAADNDSEDGKPGSRPEQFHVALIRLRNKSGQEEKGWLVEKGKTEFQKKLADPRIVEVVKIFKGRELAFEFKSIPVF